MTVDVIEKIEELCQPFVHGKGDDEFLISKEGEITQIRTELDYVAPINLHSLDALVQMIKTEALSRHDGIIYAEANGHDTVSCFLQPDTKLRFIRPTLYNVKAKDVPGWKEESDIQYEQALIAIRTRFQQSADTEYLLRLLSEISNGAKVTFSNNGVATTVVSQKGVALQGSEPIRPIITLKPYRTFQEIEQPASEFHIRISERGIRFIEADGGMWKLAARQTIVEYLKEHLAEHIEAGRVVVML